MRALETPLQLRLSKPLAKRLQKLSLETVGDLLYYAPRRYYKWGALTPIASLTEGESVTIQARVANLRLLKNAHRPGVRLVISVHDGQDSLDITFFAKNPYMLNHHQQQLQVGKVFFFAGTIGVYRGKFQLVHPEWEEVDADTEKVRQAGRPIPVYPTTQGLASWKIAAAISTVLGEVTPADLPDLVPPMIREAHGLCSRFEAITRLHQPQDDVDWQQARRTLAWEEAYLLETALLTRKYQVRGRGVALAAHALADTPAADLPGQLLAHLPFTLTSGQQEAWQEISRDLARDTPMQRLLQADVGAGKTVVALLGLLQAVEAGYQGVLLVPTEVLAAQHFCTFEKLLREVRQDLADPASLVPLHLLTSNQSKAVREATLRSLAAGELGITVGTHALIQDGVEIPKLGLLVVDEQHRFGVEQREKLRENRKLVPHLLVMTATPIPRTIAMTAFGDLDTTRMQGMPEGRKLVETILVDNQKTKWIERIWERAREEIAAGGRVYVVCPKIEPTDMETAARPQNRTGQQVHLANPLDAPALEYALELVKSQPALSGIAVGFAHGQQKPEENRRALDDFASGKAPILVATTVVEVGVDVPEATMMVVLGAQQFGLAQLHQLRGRVGRSDRASVVMLVHKHDLNAESAARLKALAETSDGFELAETDLVLRKEGDVVGSSQSGYRSGLKFLSVLKDAGIIAAARQEVEAQLQHFFANASANEASASNPRENTEDASAVAGITGINSAGDLPGIGDLPARWKENLVWLERL